jgi:deoxycytidylate deaminase
MYRNLFYLVAVTKPHAQRRSALEEKGLDEGEIDDLMEIDRNESEEGGGQRLEKTLHLADFFIRNDTSLDQSGSIRRFTRLIHGDKSLTPNRVETGMYAAYAAGLRSACLSRQVGAAILNSGGEVLATGCNDVPEAGGGLYSADSQHDYRCVHRPGQICFNDREKRKLKDSIGALLRPALKDLGITSVSDAWLADVLKGISDKTRLGSLIEFSRSVHAEMDAIVSLARRGGPGINSATLYTTTFPCHSCARHIVAAGITSVVYIEPYEKSMAQLLHKDAISFEEPQQQANAGVVIKQGDASSATEDEPEGGYKHERVRFVHFEGVAPRLFAAVFRADNRKEKSTGRFIQMLEASSQKVLPEYLDDYQKVETVAVAHFDDILKSLSDAPGLTQKP